jgi:small subunit ribosomal protein S1
MKQLQSDPWDAVEKQYAIGTVHKGCVTNITDYGAFVELEAGVEGLVHAGNVLTKKNVHPGKIVSTSQEVEVMVLERQRQASRFLGLKQTQRNPWKSLPNPSGWLDHRRRSQEHHRIRSVRGSGQRHDGMVHLSDLSWDQRGDAIANYRKGDTVGRCDRG